MRAEYTYIVCVLMCVWTANKIALKTAIVCLFVCCWRLIYFQKAETFSGTSFNIAFWYHRTTFYNQPQIHQRQVKPITNIHVNEHIHICYVCKWTYGRRRVSAHMKVYVCIKLVRHSVHGTYEEKLLLMLLVLIIFDGFDGSDTNTVANCHIKRQTKCNASFSIWRRHNTQVACR